MANTVQVAKLVEGPRSAYFHVYIKSDGVAGELTNHVLLDPATSFNPAEPPGMRLSFRKVWYSISGFDILFKFDDSGNTDYYPVWVISGAAGSGEMCLNEFGGLQDRTGIDATGKLLISTTGLTAAGDQASLVIKVNKTPKPYVAV